MSDRQPPGENPPADPLGGVVGATYGHFRIIDRLGQGGMGVVYKAIDTRLDRVVALKFLPPSLSENEEARTRFAQEARAASALDHPNICTIHEIAEGEGGQVFIAMAYYEGETLAQRIRRGPLSLEDALSCAEQVAHGLAKAHAAGIIHRDIKPANVIVTGDCVAKILDFGLAKLQDLDLTQPGMVMGTVQYMSPEHTDGRPVDQRTDIWSLGVLLYEMLAGRHPFAAGGRAAAVMYGILNEDPPSLTDTNPRVPADVERIVRGCLAKDPARRYQSADDLLADMDRSGLSTGRAPITGGARGGAPSRARRRGVRGVGLAVAALIALALIIPASREAILGGGGELRASQRSVAVLPIQSLSGDPNDEALANGLTYSLATMLVALEGDADSLRVVPASEIVNQSVRTAGEASQLFQVNVVLGGRFERDPEGRGSVTLELMRADPVDLLDVADLPGPEAAEFRDEIRAALARFFQLGNARVTRAVARSSPGEAGAYPYYVQGLGYLHRSDLADNLDNAIQLFGRAIGEDSSFALAHAGLCEARFEKFRQTRDTEQSRLALDSCDEAAALASDEPVVLTSLASVLIQTGELERALRRLGEALAADSMNADAHRWLGRYHEEVGQAGDAEREYRRAISLRPDAWIHHNELAVLLAYSPGRTEEARERFREITRLAPDNYLAHNGVGFTSIFLNEGDVARESFRRSLELRPNPIAHRNLGYLNVREGRWAEAIAELEEGLEISPTDWWSYRWLGQARWWSGDEERARQAWRRVLDGVDRLLEVNPNEADALLGKAEAHVLLGERDEGRRALDRMLLRDLGWNYFPFFIGRVYELLGSRETALQYIVEAIDAGFDIVMIDNDPWLEDLRREPAFREARARLENG